MGLPMLEVADPNKLHSVTPQCWTEAKSLTSQKSGVVAIEDLGWEDQARLHSSLGKFVHSSLFQNTTLAVIVLNGVWIGIDVQWNHYNLKEDGKLPLDPVATVIENLFCSYFTVELVMRFLAFREKKHCFQDSWFFFDLALVLFMIVETWVLTIVEAIIGGEGDGFLSKFSALRLLRLTRLSRLFKSLPELLTLIKGMINATRAVATVLCFMVLIMYVFSILFTVALGDSDAPELTLEPYWDTGSDPTGVDLFGSIGDSMMTLFTRGVLGDNLAETLEAIKDRGGSKIDCETDGDGVKTCERKGGNTLVMWLFIMFMICSAFLLLNLIVGILCGVIEQTAKEENEARNVNNAKTTLTQVFNEMDESQDGLVTKSEWGKMVRMDSVRNSLVMIGLPENDLDDKLVQVEENVFKDVNSASTLANSSEARSSEAPNYQESPPGAPSDRQVSREGIELEDFVRKILENRADQDASRLDVEVLRSKVDADEKRFSEQLGRIEDTLLAFRNNGVRRPSNAPEMKAHAVSASGELNFGSPCSSRAAWLQKIPTEALFFALERRARPKSVD